MPNTIVLNKNQLQGALKDKKIGEAGISNPDLLKKLAKSKMLDYLLLLEGKSNTGFKLIEIKNGKVMASWKKYSKKSLKSLSEIIEREAILYEFVNISVSESEDKLVKFGDIECINQKEEDEDDDEEIINTDNTHCKFHLKEKVGFRYRVIREDLDRSYIYLTVFAYTQDKKIIQLFPNKYSSSNKIRTGRENVFPSSKDKYILYGDYPIGKDKVIMIASLQPVGLPGNSPRAGIYKYADIGKAQYGVIGLKKIPQNSYDVKIITSETIK
ncbi:MAG: DUF4384 domain-containing protein [Leptospiraceae bacterium]|nr:DUF4384 domain-containing protein [Leptospiraceae bacterium]